MYTPQYDPIQDAKDRETAKDAASYALMEKTRAQEQWRDAVSLDLVLSR